MWSTIVKVFGWIMKLPDLFKWFGNMFNSIGKWWARRQEKGRRRDIDAAIEKAKKEKSTKDLQDEIGGMLD